MKRIIFYSWQSDLPNPTNRGFIQTALEKAASQIAADDTIEVEPVIDRDTAGVTGAPDIAATIFAKIAASDLFVADISIIARPKGKRPCPNPNVLIELGYALKALGPERIVLVFNKATGKIEELPFDLRMRRLAVYELRDNEQSKDEARAHLVSVLDNSIRSVLSQPVASPRDSSLSSSVESIENQLPNKIPTLRRNLQSVLAELDRIQPKMFRDGGTVEELRASINLTQEVIADFAKVSEAIAIMKDKAAAREVYKWFGRLMERYYPPANKSGRTSDADGDFFKFVGHEAFVTFIMFLMREGCWAIVREMLVDDLEVERTRRNEGPAFLGWENLSSHVGLLEQEGKKNRRVSLHADTLQERHSTSGGLGSIVPINDFIGTDIFLSIYKHNEHGSNEFFFGWYPRSIVYVNTVPSFVRSAWKASVARQIMDALNFSDVEELRKILLDLPRRLQIMTWWPIQKEDVDRIAQSSP